MLEHIRVLILYSTRFLLIQLDIQKGNAGGNSFNPLFYEVPTYTKLSEEGNYGCVAF